jgi:hypothetical protein
VYPVYPVYPVEPVGPVGIDEKMFPSNIIASKIPKFIFGKP